MKNLDNVDHTEIFVLPVEDRISLIERGSELFWRQCEMTSVLTGYKLDRILKSSLDLLDSRILTLEKEEDYELCYFLQEVVWETFKRLEKEKQNV